MHGGVTGKASDGLPMSIQPGVRSQREPWDRYATLENPEGVRQPRNPFRVYKIYWFINPGLSLRSNPGLKLANAFGVNLVGPILQADNIILQTHNRNTHDNARTKLLRACLKSTTRIWIRSPGRTASRTLT